MRPKDRGATLVALLAIGLLFCFDATFCPTAGIFGVPCPSCGLTRATLAIVQGQWARAHALHPGVLFVWLFLAIAFLLGRGASPARRRAVGRAGALLVAGLVLLWGARFAGYFGGPVAVRSWSALLTGRGTTR